MSPRLKSAAMVKHRRGPCHGAKAFPFRGLGLPCRAAQRPRGQDRLVRSRGLEPPRELPHSDLNAARLPIPPRPHMTGSRRRVAEPSCLEKGGGDIFPSRIHAELCGTSCQMSQRRFPCPLPVIRRQLHKTGRGKARHWSHGSDQRAWSITTRHLHGCKSAPKPSRLARLTRRSGFWNTRRFILLAHRPSATI